MSWKWQVSILCSCSLSLSLHFQMEMIQEPDPDDEGTKISVSTRTHHVGHCFSAMCRRDQSWQCFIPNKHNSSWFSRIIHLQPEKGANQWNQWQCIITVKVVPSLRSCSTNYSAPFPDTLYAPSVPSAPHSLPLNDLIGALRHSGRHV